MHAPLAKFSLMRVNQVESYVFPLAGSEIDLDFTRGNYYDGALGADVTDYLSCSRASIGYSQTAAGVLVSFASNELRITDLGLLVEDARTNLIIQSQVFGTTWVQGGVSVTSDAVSAPDGTMTADKLVESATNVEHRVYQGPGSGTDIGAWSVYAKAGERSWLCLSQGAGGHYAWFDLTNGVVGSTAGDFTNATIEPLANGWYRCRVHRTTGTSFFVINISPSDTGSGFNGAYSGDGTSGLYVWGAQFEIGAFVTSYTPTTTVAATRAADNVSCIGGLASVLTALPESAVADLKFVGDPAAGFIRLLYFSEASNPALLLTNTSDTAVAIFDGVAASLPATLGGSLTFTGGVKVGSAQDSSGRSIVGGGGTVSSDSTKYVGSNPKLADSSLLNFSYYRRLTAWTSRLADATLQGFTYP